MKTQWGVYFVVVLLGLAVPGLGAEDRAEFQYNFRALDVRDVAKFHEELTQRPVEIDKRVDLRLTIAFSTTKPLTKAEAIAALEAALLRQLQLEIVPVDKTKSILQPVAKKLKNPKDEVLWTLQFPGAEMAQVVATYQELTGRRVEIAKNLGIRTLQLRVDKVTRWEAAAAIEAALLKQHRLEIIPVDDTKWILQPVTVKFKSG